MSELRDDMKEYACECPCPEGDAGNRQVDRLRAELNNSRDQVAALREALWIEVRIRGHSDRWNGDYEWCSLCQGQGVEDNVTHGSDCPLSDTAAAGQAWRERVRAEAWDADQIEMRERARQAIQLGKRLFVPLDQWEAVLPLAPVNVAARPPEETEGK